jgi:hypothetical protein
VFEEVGESCLAWRFVLGADVVPNLDIDHGRAVVFDEEDTQAVREKQRFKLRAGQLNWSRVQRRSEVSGGFGGKGRKGKKGRREKQ